MKTNELTGPALDWAVAKCDGVKLWPKPQAHGFLEVSWGEEDGCLIYSPSTDWKTGGPIIEREKIGVTFRDERDEWEVPNWSAWPTQTDDRQEIMGETPLIAAMRCYVTNKLGYEVDVPEELL